MNITENDRQAVEKVLGVNLPDQDVASMSWADLRDLRDRISDAADRLCSGDGDLNPEQKNAVDKSIEVLRAIRNELEDRTSEGRKEPARMDEPLRPQPQNQKGKNDMRTEFFAPKTSWRSIWGREPKAVEGIRNFGEALKALHSNDLGKLAELRTLNNIVGEQGGYSVDEVTWAGIWDAGYETSTVLDRVRIFPMSSNNLLIPGWSSENQSKGKVGGVTASWVGEGLTASRVTPKLRLIKYEAKKLAIYVACTSEVLQDSVGVSASLLPLMRNNLTSALDAAVLSGSGVGEPAGIINSPAAINVSRETAGTVTFADIGAMMGRMIPSSLRSCVWICSPSAFSVLVALQVGTNSGVLVMNNQTGATDFRMQILGAEVRISDKLPERGDRGDLVLADLGYYGLATRESGRFERTSSAQWVSDVTDFRLILRCDGHSLLDSPVVPANGSGTLSPFVCLE